MAPHRPSVGPHGFVVRPGPQPSTSQAIQTGSNAGAHRHAPPNFTQPQNNANMTHPRPPGGPTGQGGYEHGNGTDPVMLAHGADAEDDLSKVRPAPHGHPSMPVTTSMKGQGAGGPHPAPKSEPVSSNQALTGRGKAGASTNQSQNGAGRQPPTMIVVNAASTASMKQQAGPPAQSRGPPSVFTLNGMQQRARLLEQQQQNQSQAAAPAPVAGRNPSLHPPVGMRPPPGAPPRR